MASAKAAWSAALRRVATIGWDLAAAVADTFGFARQLADQPGTHSAWQWAPLIASAAADDLLLASFQQLHAPLEDDAFATKLSESHDLVRYLEAREAFATPQSLHVAPASPVVHESSRRVAHMWFSHATYASPYAPESDMPGARSYAQHTRNDIVHAWLLRQNHPAPWIVCVHGAGMGDPVADMVAFRARSLHAAGFNVAIPVLPHHGPRGMGRFTLAFPNDDPAGNLHGAAQAIADVRAFLAYVTGRGERAVLFGISLGAYVAAAVAALESALAGVVVGVPVVDIPDLLHTHAPSRFARHRRFADLYQVARRLDPLTSPLGLATPAAPIRRIWAGRADRLVRPSQVERLAIHWEAPEVAWYQGGHLGFFTAPTVRRCISDVLVDAGVARRDSGRLIAM